MYYGYYNSDKSCRWCSKRYKAHKPIGRDGFCSKRCKQALYRARKKYVTTKSGASSDITTSTVTRKKRKICPLCNKPAIRVKDNGVHFLYIHKEAVRGKGGRACIVPTPKKRKKRK